MYQVFDGDQNRDVGAAAVTRVKMGLAPERFLPYR